MDVVIEMDPPQVTITAVHPIALADALKMAVDAALRLSRELRTVDGES